MNRARGAGLSQALAAAEAALNAGDALDAERRARAVSALVRALRDLAEFEAAADAAAAAHDDANIRAELRRRLDRLVGAELEGAPLEVRERLARALFSE